MSVRNSGPFSRSLRLAAWTLGVAAAVAASLARPAGQSSGPAQAGRSSPDIHFVPTPQSVVDTMLEVARVTAADVIYDLGSGDGRVVITAAQRYGARGVGIEIDPALVSMAEDRARRAGVADMVRFQTADLFKTDLSSATVVTLYLSPSINLRLRPKLLRELRPGTRLVSHRFDMGDWKPERDVTVDGKHVLLWTIPAR